MGPRSPTTSTDPSRPIAIARDRTPPVEVAGGASERLGKGERGRRRDGGHEHDAGERKTETAATGSHGGISSRATGREALPYYAAPANGKPQGVVRIASIHFPIADRTRPS